jgi:hypothetical protein
MKTFKQYLKDKKLEESIQGNIALGLGAAGALMGLGGREAQAQSTQSSQPRLTASEKGSLKNYSRSDLQQKMAEAGKFNKDAYKVGVRASHVSSQIMNTLISRNALSIGSDEVKQEHGTTGLFLSQTMKILDAMHKDTSGESHDELLKKLLKAYKIDENSDAFFRDGSINYKEALRMISNTATSLAAKLATTKNESFTRNLGRNLALAAGGIGGMMGLGSPAQAQAQTPQPQPRLTPEEKAELKSFHSQWRAEKLGLPKDASLKDILKAQAKEDSAALSPDNPFFDAPSPLRIKVKAEVVHSRLKSIIWSIPGVKFEQRENSTFISGLGDDENEKLVLLEYTMTTLRKIAASKSSKEQEAMISELSKKLNIDKLNPEEQMLNIIDNPQGISLEKIRDAAFVLIDELQKQNKNKKR